MQLSFLVAFLVGSLLVLTPAWKFLRPVVAVWHETSHASAAVLTSGQVDEMVIAFESYVRTLHRSGLSILVTRLAGYPGPAWLALAVVAAVLAGYGSLVAWLAAAFLLGLCFAARAFRTFGILASFSALLALAAWFSPPVLPAALVLLAGFISVGSLRTLFEERAARAGGAATDVSALPGGRVRFLWWWFLLLLTGLPVGFTLFALVSA